MVGRHLDRALFRHANQSGSLARNPSLDAFASKCNCDRWVLRIRSSNREDISQRARLLRLEGDLQENHSRRLQVHRKSGNSVDSKVFPLEQADGLKPERAIPFVKERDGDKRCAASIHWRAAEKDLSNWHADLPRAGGAASG